MKKFNNVMRSLILFPLFIIVTAAIITGCSSAQGNQAPPPPPALPVLQLDATSTTTYEEYSASLEGKTNVEIRPQVSGYLDKIYVEEGAYVTAGQPLFKINDRPYDEQVNNAQANVLAAKANLEKADIEVKRLQPLVENKVVSDVQLKAAQAEYEAAKAAVKQAEAAGNNAGINLGWTVVKAPVSGYIGRIPFKTGALVGKGETQALTVVSDVKEVYAYFSMSEKDFLEFTGASAGKSIAEKIKGMPAVELQLADKSTYPAKGKVELMEGQFDKNMGTIQFRAVFPNGEGLLRTGSTGKIRIPENSGSTLAVPQQSTYEVQDKVFVYILGDSNKVMSQPINISGQTTAYYLVNKGLQPGQKIVFAGMDRLRDGAVIQPQVLAADSVRHAIPL
ncbi:MAG: efflux transporter periplasmic adaptor subunit [Sphingobacteriales bacterium 50-39]|nr:MAG: efflux transporter periplasmic adaptor subunit [Sphingobacteriales bacterium 50-39]